MNRKNKTMSWKDPPFQLDRSQCGIPLTRQVCIGFEHAIDTGYYAPGDKLPPVRAQMTIFDVSLSVAEYALIMLMKTGKVYVRPGIGTIVANRNAPAHRGSVVFTHLSSQISYYVRTFGSTFAATVQEAGYACTTVYISVTDNGTVDFSALDRALLHSPDLVVLLLPTEEIERHLSDAGVEFVVIGRRPCLLPGCRGWIKRARNAATPDFFRHCRKAGVRSIHQLYYEDIAKEVLSGVTHPGIEIRSVRLGKSIAAPTLSEVRQIGYAGLLRHYRSRQNLPDLLFVTDDIMAAGVILALAQLNVRVPEDVRLVSWIHHGDAPAAPYELTRIETEPTDHGRITASAVLALMDGQPNALKSVEITPVYRIGQSFP